MPVTSQRFDVAERQAYIGCSEFGAILGFDKYRTPLDVFNEKTGLSTPFEGNRHTLRGQRLESVAADLYYEETGRKLRRMTRDLVHPTYSFIRGHIDRLVEGESRIAEIKCPSLAMYRKIQREGLPESMIVQLQGYLGLSGHKQGVWIVFCADQMDLLHFEVDFHPAIYQAAVDAAERFWTNHIIANTPPELSTNGFKKPEFEIAKTNGTVTFRDDEMLVGKSQSLVEAMQLVTDAEQLFEMAKTDYVEAIEDTPGVYECGGLRVHYTEQNGRTTFDKKALAARYPEIDLTFFEKTGKPFKTFRPYILNKTRE